MHAGYLAVFEYEGNMVFNVKIFYKKGCPRQYARTPTKRRANVNITIAESSKNKDRKLGERNKPRQRRSEVSEETIPEKASSKRKTKEKHGDEISDEGTEEGIYFFHRCTLIEHVSYVFHC